MKKDLLTSFLMTVVTTLLLGLAYPLIITGIAQVLFRDKANGQLISRDGQLIGSRIIGQSFTGPGYFHSRPSAAGDGYDAANSNGSNLGPTNKKLIDRVNVDTGLAFRPRIQTLRSRLTWSQHLHRASILISRRLQPCSRYLVWHGNEKWMEIG
jgi:K+-transporting ATPase KdpC subunit